MSAIAWLLSVLLIPVFGLWILAIIPTRSLAAPVGTVAATGAGLVSLSLLMLFEDFVGIRWSVAGLTMPLLGINAIAFWFAKRSSESRFAPSPVGENLRPRPWILFSCIPVAVFAVATMSGAATAFDLLFFWGSKGARFAHFAGIDVSLLANPHNVAMHPDYPPLLPLLYAWTALWTGDLQWFGAIALSPIAGLLIILSLYGCARGATPSSVLHPVLFLGSSILSLLFVDLYIAGDAEPFLLFFQALALAFGTWLVRRDERFDVVVGIALTGVVLTKLEGVVFTAGFILASIVTLRGSILEIVRRLVRIALVPAASLAAWVTFAAHHRLLDAYRGSTVGGLNLDLLPLALPTLWKEAGLGFNYLPWLVLVGIILLGRLSAKVAIPLAIATLYLPFLAFVYAHGTGDPTELILTSARRVLLTPLLCMLVAAIAAHENAGGFETSRSDSGPKDSHNLS